MYITYFRTCSFFQILVPFLVPFLAPMCYISVGGGTIMLKKLISECSDYDFKEDLEIKKPRSWLKSVSAFANGIGGSLFFGVDNNGNSKDLTDLATKSDKISELIKTRIDPIPLFLLVPHEIENKQILELQVQPGISTPYYYHFDGSTVAYIRSGNETIEAPIHILNELILKGTGQTYDGVVTGYKFEDFAFSFLKSKYLKRTQLKLNDSDFVSFGLVKNDCLTRAGLLFADENNLLQSRIFCTRWNGTDKVSENEAVDDDEISGSIVKQLDAAFDFYKKNTKKPWHKEGEGTVNEPEYDDIAITEALVNAIIHRDYNIIGAEVCLNIYDDRIEITSPGMMFSGKKIPEVVDYTMESTRRNPIIADVFNRMNLMNRRGSGLSNITNRTNALFKDGKNHVFYKAEDGFFVVKIENALSNKNKKIEEGIRISESFISSYGILTINESYVYTEIKNDPRITYDGLAEKTGISRRTVARAVASLEAKGYIARKESKKDEWTILK